MSGLMATIAKSKSWYKTDISVSYLVAFYAILPEVGENGVVSYQQVRERESERSALITDRRR